MRAKKVKGKGIKRFKNNQKWNVWVSGVITIESMEEKEKGISFMDMMRELGEKKKKEEWINIAKTFISKWKNKPRLRIILFYQ